MILEGEQIRKKGLISQTIDENSQLQPCGMDLSVLEIYKYIDKGIVDFSNQKRKLPKTEKLDFDNEDKIHLPKGIYKIKFNEYVKIPNEYAAMCFTRSTLLRCGANMEFALWDPGYEGRSESMLVVSNENGIILYKNARVAQMVFLKLEKSATKGYDGIYKGENKI